MYVCSILYTLCVCVCVCVCVCACVRVRACVCLCVCVCLYTYIHTYINVHTHVQVCARVRTHASLRARARTHKCTCTCTGYVCNVYPPPHITCTTHNTNTPYTQSQKNPNPPPQKKIGGSPRPGRYMHIPPHPWCRGYVGGAHEHQSTACHFPRLFRLCAEVSSSSKESSSSPQQYPPSHTSCHFPRLFRLCAQAHILKSIRLLKNILLLTTFPLSPSPMMLRHTLSKVFSLVPLYRKCTRALTFENCLCTFCFFINKSD